MAEIPERQLAYILLALKCLGDERVHFAVGETDREVHRKDYDKAAEWVGTAEARIRELEQARERDEKAHLETIDQRDAAEDALGQAYFLITGRSPEWSNLFGHEQALEDVDDAQQTLRKSIANLQAQLQAVTQERDLQVGNNVFAKGRMDQLEIELAQLQARNRKLEAALTMIRDHNYTDGMQRSFADAALADEEKPA